MKLNVLIPAAGEGQRLRPHTIGKPKVMLEVAGKPIIAHIIESIIKLNPEKVCVVVPPGDKTINRYLELNYDLPFETVVQEEPKGLGHALLCAEGVVKEGPVLILLGDTIVELDFTTLFNSGPAIGVKVVDDPRRFGVVLLENGMIKNVVEKPSTPISNLAIVGVYYFPAAEPLYRALNRLVIENRLVGREYLFTDALQILVDEGMEIRTVDVSVWLDCGTPEALLETNRVLLNRQVNCPQITGSVVIPPVLIADDAVVENSVIGPYVSVSSRAVVQESVISDSLVYQGAEVRRSVLWRSIIGEKARVEGVSKPVNVGPEAEINRSDRC